jgi:two-component system response regulator YesN
MRGDMKMQVNSLFLRVLLVDDEPFIRRGLAALIDWESEGYIITGEASNGISAIQLLEANEYDLIISDIKMPDMDGIELITYVKNHNLSNARFVFLSGYYDFQYARTAIRYNCCDYILKPIQREELITTLRRIREEYLKEAGNETEKRVCEKAYMESNLTAILWGKYDEINMRYVTERLRLTGELAYIHCEISLNDEFLANTEDNRIGLHRKLYQYAGLVLKNYSDHIIFDTLKHTQCYGIGIIYCSYMAEEKRMSQEEWLKWLVQELSDRVGYEIAASAGDSVKDIRAIVNSYREAIMVRTFRFYIRQDNKLSLLYKKESDSKSVKTGNFKRQIDELIHAIEINDRLKIKTSSKELYQCIMDKNTDPEEVTKSIQYMLYRLLGIAYNQDADINQEEIMQYIRETVFSPESNYESARKFRQFAVEYSDYMVQLRQNCAKGTINLIEDDIEENYTENLSLKYFGEKYYINSAYLGQLFKKQFGCSFKDYLNSVRLRKAAELMLSTNKKVYEIAGDVGYKNLEYFINKFEEVYGVTPTRFRKRGKQEDYQKIS